VAVVEVLVDGIADGPAPGVGAEGGAEIAGGKVLAGEKIGQFTGEFIGGAGCESLRAWSEQKWG